jgi:hypothetical protein
MTDDNRQPGSNNRSEPAASEQSSQRPQQGQADTANAAPQPDQRVAPGRRPLFRS